MSAPKPKATGARLKIPVNPEYNLEGDPSENEFAYINPVALNNQLIVLANELLTLADVRVGAERAIAQLKLELRKAQRMLEDSEEQLLRDSPLSPTEAKNLKTTAAAIAARVKQAGLEVVYLAKREEMRALEDKIEEQIALANRSRIYSDVAEQVSENIKTHLSYLKKELENSGRHGRYGA